MFCSTKLKLVSGFFRETALTVSGLYPSNLLRVGDVL